MRSWISGSGSAAASATSTSTTTSSGTGRPERPRELARDDLRHERLLALSGAAELRHVHAVVVGLDEPGQRPALAQGLDVAGGGDGAQRARSRRAAWQACPPDRPAPIAWRPRWHPRTGSSSRSRSATTARRRAGRWTARASTYTERRHIQLVHWAAAQARGRRHDRAGAAHGRRRVRRVAGDPRLRRRAHARRAAPVPGRRGARAPRSSRSSGASTRCSAPRDGAGSTTRSSATRAATRRGTSPACPAGSGAMFPFVLAPAKLVIRRYLDVNDDVGARRGGARRRGVRRRRASGSPTDVATSSATASAPPT